jgi:hypothetical protein
VSRVSSGDGDSDTIFGELTPVPADGLAREHDARGGACLIGQCQGHLVDAGQRVDVAGLWCCGPDHCAVPERPTCTNGSGSAIWSSTHEKQPLWFPERCRGGWPLFSDPQTSAQCPQHPYARGNAGTGRERDQTDRSSRHRWRRLGRRRTRAPDATAGRPNARPSEVVPWERPAPRHPCRGRVCAPSTRLSPTTVVLNGAE